MRLETRLQRQLFNRTTRAVHLTDTGRAFLDHCRRIITDRDEAFALMSEGTEPQGDLRVTCSTPMGEKFIAPLARQFALDHPKVNVTLELTNHLVDIVADGFDLAIRTGQLADSRLIGTRIASRTLHTCAAPKYLRSRAAPRRVSDLSQHDCLIGTAATWHFQRGNREELFRPKGRWRCNNGTAVKDAAVAGMGICQLPDFYVLREIADGRLITVLEECQPEPEPIWALYPQRRHLSPKVNSFIELLRSALPPALRGETAQ